MSASKIIIRGAKILGGEEKDVLIEDGVIADVAAEADLDPGAGDVCLLHAEGHVLLPGLVDLHTHLREPGREDAETVATGTRAAAITPAGPAP